MGQSAGSATWESLIRLLSERSNFFSKLDLSMQYYHFELDGEFKELCTGLWRPLTNTNMIGYLWDLPAALIGRTKSWKRVLMNIHEVECYINDIGCFTDSWERHIAVMDEVLARLDEAGFSVNPLKCEWGVKETNWLGYWLTPTGLKPGKRR